jgi:hypothetical protein
MQWIQCLAQLLLRIGDERLGVLRQPQCRGITIAPAIYFEESL